MTDTQLEYAKLFETFALEDTVLSADPGETIKLGPSTEATLASLPPLNLADGADIPGAELNLGATLGEGGIGIVRAATQRPFDRSVALKTLRDSGTAAHAHSLVREAIAAGRLEHPNVVPIYALGRDADDHPVIVMKRIDGGSWRERFQAGHDLQFHLGVFIDVCSAIAFAHERGILHRDLKPDNVMVGTHDDVYVVDWGLAVTLEPDPTGKLPVATNVDGVAGTPAYMAPEMAAGGGQPIDARSDVYCLGAILHELVTGTLRHSGDTVFQMMLSAYQTAPVEYGPDVPAELGAICNRATARDPADRFQSALELREAVRNFLRHRIAATLTSESLEELVALGEALGDEALEADERRVQIYRHYGAARFGFERSLEEWAEQPPAREGLQRTLELMIAWELDNGSTHAAAALLAELPEPNAALAERLAAAERNREAEREELRALRHDQFQRDIRVGARARVLVLLDMVVFAFIVPLVLANLTEADPYDSPTAYFLVAVVGTLGLIVAFAVVWWRPLPGFALERTDTNWKLGLSTVVAGLWLVAARGMSIVMGVPVPHELVFEMLAFGAFTAILAVIFDYRILAGSAIFVLGAPFAFAFPDYSFEIFVSFDAAALLAVAIAWHKLSLKNDPETVDTNDDVH